MSTAAVLTALEDSGIRGAARAAPSRTPPAAQFGFDDVVKPRARPRHRPFRRRHAPLPDALNKLDFDAWRDIRFRPTRRLSAANGPFRLQLFHLGHLFKRPVTINIDPGRHPDAHPFTTSLFDYGRTKLDQAAAGQSRLRRLSPALSAELRRKCSTR